MTARPPAPQSGTSGKGPSTDTDARDGLRAPASVAAGLVIVRHEAAYRALSDRQRGVELSAADRASAESCC